MANAGQAQQYILMHCPYLTRCAICCLCLRVVNEHQQQHSIPKEIFMPTAATHRPVSQLPALAKVLATTSVGLGVTELLAPAFIANFSGVAPTPRGQAIIRALGARELAHGFAVGTWPALAWTRMAGDILDIALLAVGHRKHPANTKRGLIAAALLTAIAGLDVAATRRYFGTT